MSQPRVPRFLITTGRWNLEKTCLGRWAQRRRPLRGPCGLVDDRQLGGLVWDFSDVLRHCVAGNPPSKLLDQTQPGSFTDFEMSRTGNAIELVQVVRLDTMVDQPQRQPFQCF